ncbi:MAG: ComF family protein [Lachnospiraceae bacterium]|nr:ComF family protein [Lachnospiraceae bacterium]
MRYAIEGVKEQDIKKQDTKKRELWRRLLDLLYPPKCPICEEPSKGFCPKCALEAKYAGLLYQKDGKGQGSRSYEAVYAVFRYDFVASGVYHLKYEGKRDYGRTLGQLMWQEAEEILRSWKIDCIVPVPLHAKRQKKRGFNQSQILAEAISKGLGIPVFPEMVLRCRNTKPMKDLNALQRQNNLKKAFKMGQNDVKLKTILIVDDIYTTGATTDEISRLLLEAGAAKVYVLTLGSDAEDGSALQQGGYL